MNKFLKVIGAVALATTLAFSVSSNSSDQADGIAVVDSTAGGATTNATADPGGKPGG